MNRLILAAPLFATLATSPISTAAAVFKPLVPTGKWVVNFADNQCLATRDYGPPGKPLYLVLKPSPKGQVMKVSIVRKGAGREAIQVPATIRFDNDQPIESNVLAFASPKNGVRMISVNLADQHFAPMRRAKVVSIRAAGELDESFALEQIAPLMKEIDRCVVGLQEYWNIGEANNGRFKERARANLASYFSGYDYPGAALNRGETGIVAFTLLIDEKGKVADCTLVETSGVASLDAQTCAILITRAQFKPAVGTNGKPAKDSVIGRVRWKTR